MGVNINIMDNWDSGGVLFVLYNILPIVHHIHFILSYLFYFMVLGKSKL